MVLCAWGKDLGPGQGENMAGWMLCMGENAI